mmetsp:Transcript_29779/g.22086  ORF Transcript_29779/g.22086 Transcript_29779/m.22086 type:complete len:95 (-) Transcript_29779:322-606(-)
MQDSESGHGPGVVRLFEVRKNYSKGTVAIRNLNLEAERGKCLALLGANGAGKTTLFRLLTGQEEQDRGSIWVKQWNLKEEFQEVIANVGIGYCP